MTRSPIELFWTAKNTLYYHDADDHNHGHYGQYGHYGHDDNLDDDDGNQNGDPTNPAQISLQSKENRAQVFRIG